MALPAVTGYTGMAKTMSRGALRGAANRRYRKIMQTCTCCTSADFRAAYDACPAGSHIDHRIPLAIGGKHCISNFQTLTQDAHELKTVEDNRNIATVRRVWCLLGIEG